MYSIKILIEAVSHLARFSGPKAREFKGSAAELSDTDLPTYGDTDRYLYHVRTYESSFPTQLQVKRTDAHTKAVFPHNYR